MTTTRLTHDYDGELVVFHIGMTIRKPHRQPRFQHTAWGFVTLAFWGFYFYLWAPLVTLLSWLIGGQLAWQQLYERQNQLDPYVLVALPLMLLCASVLLIGWAEYNRVRFQGRENRRAPALVERSEVAAASLMRRCDIVPSTSCAGEEGACSGHQVTIGASGSSSAATSVCAAVSK